MTVNRFGTDVDPSAFVEVEGSGNPPLRPSAAYITANGLVMLVRNYVTQASLPSVTIEPDTGYWNTTVVDVPEIEVSADGGSHWVPFQSPEGLHDAIVSGGAANAAQTTASAALTQITDLIATIGEPGGLAQLGADGTLTALQAAGISPQVQNSDGTWNDRPATTRPVFWWRIVGGSAAPDTNGTTAGGAGMVDGYDVIVDLAADLGT